MEEICGNCIHYKGGDEPYCRKGNRYFGYLRHMKCFNTTSESGSPKMNKGLHIIKDGVEMKTCRVCLRDLPLNKFAKNKNNADGLQYLCHHCFHIKYHKKIVQDGNQG